MAGGGGRTVPREGSLDGLLAAKEIVIACGPGGVGKTTTAAAAAAMAACHQGGRVLVLTSTRPAGWPTRWDWRAPGRRGSATASAGFPTRCSVGPA